MSKYDFVFYKGEDLIEIGSRQEIAKKLNLTPSYITYLKSPSYLKRYEKMKNRKNSPIVIKIEKVEEVWKI